LIRGTQKAALFTSRFRSQAADYERKLEKWVQGRAKQALPFTRNVFSYLWDDDYWDL
jgi:hypothetical protein